MVGDYAQAVYVGHPSTDIKKMHILFISDNFPPEINAPASRTYEHCKRWVDQGADVTVITCAPNFPQGRVHEGYRNRFYQKEVVDGIKVVRVWSYIAENKGFFKRVVDHLSFAFMAFWVGLFEKADIMVATSPQFFTTFAGFTLSKVKRRPWVFELRDLWPESIISVGAMRENWALRLLTKIEYFLYRDADLIIPVTDAFKNHLEARGIDSNKIVVVTNGVDSERFHKKEKNSDLVRSLGLDGKFVIGYVGTHGMAHGLDFIVRSLKNVKDERFHFLFIGDGAEKKKIISISQDLKLKNISFIDPVSKERVVDYLSVLDASLINLKKSDTFKTVIPSKIFESACMEKPILLGVDGQARQIVEKYNAGIFFEPENEAEFISAINKLEKNPELYRALQKGEALLAKDYDRDGLADEMLKVLKKEVARI